VPALAFLFPGPGATSLGLGAIKPLYNACPPLRAALDQADKLMLPSGLKPSRVCFAGPEEDLLKPSISGPVLLALSQGLVQTLRQRAIRPQMVLGHGFGEVAALVAAGVLSYPEGLNFLRRRGEIIEAAWSRHPYYALSLTGLSLPALEQALLGMPAPPLLVAVNSPDHLTLAGAPELLERAATQLADGRRVKASAVQPGMAWPHPSLRAASQEVEAAFRELALERSGGVEIFSAAAGGMVGRVEELAALQALGCHQLMRFDLALSALMARGANTLVALVSGAPGAWARRINGGVRALPAEDAHGLSQTFQLAL
jgi:[acyl-carrier-protein] S-malonyltransferase